ncbi:hypothetical protein C7475_102644 [Chitinophaga sp. S165]|nr:hypothetical protein C7475_102644 [Chitinophaga sp. S165]
MCPYLGLKPDFELAKMFNVLYGRFMTISGNYLYATGDVLPLYRSFYAHIKVRQSFSKGNFTVITHL